MHRSCAFYGEPPGRETNDTDKCDFRCPAFPFVFLWIPPNMNRVRANPTERESGCPAGQSRTVAQKWTRTRIRVGAIRSPRDSGIRLESGNPTETDDAMGHRPTSFHARAVVARGLRMPRFQLARHFQLPCKVPLSPLTSLPPNDDSDDCDSPHHSACPPHDSATRRIPHGIRASSAGGFARIVE